jgi:hypothetical protein
MTVQGFGSGVRFRSTWYKSDCKEREKPLICQKNYVRRRPETGQNAGEKAYLYTPLKKLKSKE